MRVLSGQRCADQPSAWHPTVEDLLAVTPLELSIDHPNRRISVQGELDLVGAEGLSAAMATLRDLRPGGVTVDLAAVTLIDGRGLGCLVDCNNRLTATGETLSITGTTDRVRRMFALTGLGHLLALP
jgi:anti-sigma B factor antagonist